MIWFFGMLAALIALEIALHIAVAVQSPREARTPKDERERLIDMKASRVAFYVLLVGTFASMGTLHIPGSNRLIIAQCLMGSIIFTALSRFADADRAASPGRVRWRRQFKTKSAGCASSTRK